MGRVLFGFFALLCLASAARAQIDNAPKVHARLIAEHDQVTAGSTVTVALEEIIRPGWHTYWRNPGDAGAPTEIKWNLPSGWLVRPIQWPYPKELPVGPLMDYGYEGKVWLLSDLKVPPNAPSGALVLKAAVSWLVCKEVCIPEDTTLTLPLVAGTSASPPDTITAPQFAAARAKLSVPSPWPARFALNDGVKLFLVSPKLAAADLKSARFFPFEEGVIKGIAPQELGTAQNGVVLKTLPGKRARANSTLSGVLVLTSRDGTEQALSIAATRGFVPAASFRHDTEMSFPLALFFALLGGLILNLMPCVLPILAMKALAVASHTGKTGHEAAREGIAYGIGAVTSFAALGMTVVLLRAGGASIGWGFQLQEPIVVALFALLMFAVGLNLSGVYEIPGIGAGEALARRGGSAGAFFTGILAVAVAAPCTAPFMAAALGFALTQNDAIALSVFVALGVGFAAPFVALALWPRFYRALPKPGAWMITFRQLLAFPLFATALWLAWVLSVQSGPDRVIMLFLAALVLAFGLWAIGATQAARGWKRLLGAVPLVAALLAAPEFASQFDSAPHAAAAPVWSGVHAEAFTRARLDALRAEERPVFVNATAAWCVTCLVNEKVALSDSRVRAAFAAHNIAYLVADWTRRNVEVTALLNSHGRDGVPLYIYYLPGAADGKVLPQILTPDTILRVINER